MGRENCWKNHYTFLNVENNAGWRQYAKSVLSQNTIILIHPSWLMLFMLFWAFQAEKFYLSQRLTRSMGVNIAVQGNLWHFFSIRRCIFRFLSCVVLHLAYFPHIWRIEFVYAPSGKWPLKTIMGVLLKDVAFEKSSSEMHCKVYLL